MNDKSGKLTVNVEARASGFIIHHSSFIVSFLLAGASLGHNGADQIGLWCGGAVHLQLADDHAVADGHTGVVQQGQPL
jgi:hypothetical protein